MSSTDRPIFVLGCPRSGTTLVQLMLHCHPRIAIPPETRFVMRTYRLRERWGDLNDPRNRRRLARWLTTTGTTRVANLGLRPKRLRRRIMAAPPTVGSAVGVVLQSYARRFDKQRWGDKRPAYYLDVPALLKMFPDAQFVEVVRDGRDTVASLGRVPWHRGNVVTAACVWAEAIDYGNRHAGRLREDQWHSLRYEDLVAEPEAVLRRLCRFLDEDYAPEMRETHRVAQRVLPPGQTWHDRLRQSVNASSIGRHAATLSLEDRALLEHVLGSRLAAKGYPVDHSLPRPPAARLAAYAGTSARRRLARRWKRVQDARLDRRATRPVAALLTSGQRAAAGLPPGQG